MEIIEQNIALENSYKGVEGLISYLNQNILEGEKSGFPLKFRVNIIWTEEEIRISITQKALDGYDINYYAEENYWSINQI